ncbi:MAG: right-handed parallel beta-helix repeat-containing protein, partial [Phycisphaeraceae bacterium]|nr:right-handed parallel beta-helix repeat-containing protein [Phycisphaeraceae bacterium]
AAVLYVDHRHAAAADENVGTDAAPLKTINGAARKVKPGDLVIVRRGVYRETVVTKIGGEGEGSRVTFRAEPKHQAIVDGADVITGFEAVANRPGIYLRKNTTPMWPRFVAKEWAATAFSTCREQTYVDGQLLRQVLRMDDLQPGTFFAEVHGDHGPRDLYVQLESNADPNQHRVEYTTRQRLWECPAPYVTIEGFVLQHALTNRRPSAAVLPGPHALLADNVIQWANGHGVAIRATAKYRGNILQHNGSLGGAGGGENVLFEGNVVRHNNWRRFGTGIYGWEEGGVKFVGLSSSTVRGNDVYRNDGSGLWFDMRCGDVIVENNRCHHNQPFAAYKGYTSGIVVEISRNFVIRNNLCFNNGRQQWAAAGITLAYSYDCRVVNNTCYGNRFGIAAQEHRSLTSPERFDPPIDCSGDIGDPRTRRTPPPCYDTIENNLCFDNEEAQFAMRFADESFRPEM